MSRLQHIFALFLLFLRLRDESSHVRKNTLMVLTHLILNDMVKVKGQISEMATCLEDKDNRISDLAKLFFLELSKKVKQSVNLRLKVIGANSVAVRPLIWNYVGISREKAEKPLFLIRAV